MNREPRPDPGFPPALALFVLALMLLAGTACGGAGEPGGEASPSPEVSPTERPLPAEPEGTLAFVAATEAAWDIYVLDIEEGESKGLTQDAIAHWPRWSPDGRRLAFLSLPPEEGILSTNGKLVTLTADGAQEQTLAAAGGTKRYSPVLEWSPDGTRIAWETTQRSEEVLLGINVIDLATGEINELAPEQASAMPAWSPDGSRIAFISYRDEGATHSDIYIMEADGTNIRRFADTGGDDLAPRWSPDGRRIVWWAPGEEGPPPHLFMAEVDDGKAKELGTGSRPVWSPDGRHIAFMDEVEEDNVEIFVMDLDTEERVNVTNDPAGDMWVVWSPDGGSLAFVSERDDPKGEIYVMGADGSNVQRLTNNELSELMIAWIGP
jgi:TolB protein